MAIADEKIKPATSRHVIVQVTGKRLIDSLMSQVEGESVVYQEYYLPESMKNFKKLVVSGTEYTLDNINPLPTPSKFNYNSETRRLVINKTDHVADTTNSFVIYFDLFYTQEKIRYVDYTDAAGTTYKVEALPKLLDVPAFSQSIKNVYSGIISFGQVGLRLDDTDRAFKILNTLETSFFNSDVKFSFYLNELLVETYTGTIKSLAFNGLNIATLSVTDNFNALKNDASFGDSTDDYIVDYVDYPKLDPSKQGAVIPYFIGKSSYGVPIRGKLGSGFVNTFSEAMEAINYDYDDENTSANNNFILGRVGPEGVPTQSFGSTATITHNIGEDFFTVSGNADTFNIKYADTFYANPANDGGPYKEYLCFCEETNGTGYAKFKTVDRFGVAVSPAAANEKITVGAIEFRKSVQACFRLSDGTITLPLGSEVGLTDDLVITETTLASGNKLVTAQVNAGFLSSLSPTVGGYRGPRNPGDTLLFTMQSAEPCDQTDFMKRILSSAGVPFIPANIEQSQADFDKRVVCQIPAKGETSLPSYLQIAETLLMSTIGFLYFDLNGEIQYKVMLDIDAGSYEKVDENAILEKTISTAIEYEDICDKVRFETKYYNHDLSLKNKSQVVDSSNKGGVEFTAYDIDAKNLHEIDKTFTVNHCLEYWDNVPVNRWQSLVANRKATYQFSISAQLVDKVINDNINLETGALVGENNNENIKILSIKKSTNDVKITATDLAGFYNF